MAHLFSNGTEYHEFMNHNCARCKRFVDWEEATDEHPVCPIEEELALGLSTTEMKHADKLTPNGYMHRHDCTALELVEEAPQ